MILPHDITPEKSLYVIGSQILTIFKKEPHKTIEAKDLFDKYAKEYKSEITFNYFLYALDWLYILNLVELNEKFRLKKCY